MGWVSIAQEREEPAEVETNVRPSPPENSAEDLKSEQGDDGRMTRQAILGDDELNGDENESKLRLGGGRVWEWKGENRTWNGC